MTLRVAVAGAGGRMGRLLIEAVQAAPDCTLVATLSQDTPDVTAALADAQVLIDFTRPEATAAYVPLCAARGVAMVIGTTGLTEAQRAAIARAATQIPIVLAPNMSVGVTVALALLEQATRALGAGWDVEVIEAHHRHKVDAPSGTALAMGEAVAHARGQRLADVARYAREGQTGERPDDEIGFATVRGGDIIGEHTVLFAGEGERIEIRHLSSGRGIYASGALRAARFVATAAPGFYDMQQVLTGSAP
ncbi:MAG: 4-hydroxy-tetrahydrodipicolinate reductase [Proteobacteria bacterium]|nr:4-hydroxy-tetrahydrodipicolinate reductase [Pseudomonadota bacterium]